MKKDLLNSFEQNKRNFDFWYRRMLWHEKTSKNDKEQKMYDIIRMAEFYGKCKMIVGILYNEFETDIRKEIKEMKTKLYTEN